MNDPSISARYAVVVPSQAVTVALRVDGWVRQLLAIDVYELGLDGSVTRRS